MRIQASREFGVWFENARTADGPLLTRAASLLAVLRDLAAKPDEETSTLKRVRQSSRHEIWRLGHPFDPNVAVRILCWFAEERVVVVLIGGDKAGMSDVWYDSATQRAEAAVDQWKREHDTKEQP